MRLGPVLEARLSHRHRDPPFGLVLVEVEVAERPRAGRQPTVAPAVEGRVLRHVADPQALARGARPGRGLLETGQDPQEGGLARIRSGPRGRRGRPRRRPARGPRRGAPRRRPSRAPGRRPAAQASPLRAGDEGLLGAPRQLLDAVLFPQGLAPGPDPARPDEDDRPPGPRVARGGPGLVLAQAGRQVLRRPGVERRVAAAQDVDEGQVVTPRWKSRFRRVDPLTVRDRRFEDPPEGNLEGPASRVVMDRAIDFIDRAATKRQPFFATIWFHEPHDPVVAGPQYQAMYSRYGEGRQHYYGCITAMDEQIGRLRSRLTELGIAGNTMIWFSSDNGPEGRTGQEGRFRGSAGGLRGRKRSLFDGGLRVPALLEWPGHARPRSDGVPRDLGRYRGRRLALGARQGRVGPVTSSDRQGASRPGRWSSRRSFHARRIPWTP